MTLNLQTEVLGQNLHEMILHCILLNEDGPAYIKNVTTDCSLI